MSDEPPDVDHGNDYAPGSFGCHEALHMASELAGMVERSLCDHPAIEQNAAWAAKAREAQAALYDLYEMIGAKHL